MIPVITKYMSALDVALLANSLGRDAEGAKKNFTARKHELQTRLADTEVIPEVRSGVSTLLNGGQALLDGALANSIGLPDRVTAYIPILLTAEDAINASARIDSEQIRRSVRGLSRAVEARGQLTLQEILVTRGAGLPEPQLRAALIALAGTEPATLFGMSEALGVGSPDATTLHQQRANRMAIVSDPASALVDNPELLHSMQITQGIAERVISGTTASVTKSAQGQAADRGKAAFRDAVLVSSAILLSLASLVVPLRAPKLAQTDRETRLPKLVNDMFEATSRRSRSLVDQQLLLIDRLERNEEDPDRLANLSQLDQLTTRLRRNSVNLLVLAGARIARDPPEPVPLSRVLNAAVSRGRGNRRVKILGVPDCAVTEAAVGGVLHLLAELIDNALRYSPPTTPVQVLAADGVDGGALLRVCDAGLGMSDAERRIANLRLQAGGEAIPDDAGHLGLFVVARLAARHGIRVGLHGPASAAGSGTTAEVYLPPAVLAAAETVGPAGVLHP